jgi:hypothetical protein
MKTVGMGGRGEAICIITEFRAQKEKITMTGRSRSSLDNQNASKNSASESFIV